MNIIYISSLLSNNYFEEIFNLSINKPGQQVQRFHRLIVEGLIENKTNVFTISAPSISRQTTKKSWFGARAETQNQIEFYHLAVLNFPLIKNILFFIQSFVKTILLIEKNKNVYIIYDVLNISTMIGSLLAAKIFRKETIGIVTDMPQHLINKRIGLISIINNYFIKKMNSYIFLTQKMNDSINLNNKPYLIIEGVVDKDLIYSNNELESKNESITLMYAGGIEKHYGIDYMVKGFIKANLKSHILNIYGSGGFEDDLREICKSQNNIFFHGVIKNQEILKEENLAHLLVNPRFSKGEYTEYSFPSKILEYMSSGTAVLTTNLSGMPKEYHEYVYLIEDETVEGFARALIEIFDKPLEEIHNKGLEAKAFVMNEKNNYKQTRKIIDMIKNDLGLN